MEQAEFIERLRNNIPRELIELRQWVNWRRIWDEKMRRQRKIPINPRTNSWASVKDANTWSDFETALRNLHRSDGIGFVFTEDDEFMGGDFDNQVDPVTGEINPEALRIINALRGYVEFSPSKSGLHLILKAKLFTRGRRRSRSLGETENIR
jgi:primase-polymerase (primpol)-like protein